MLEHLIESDDRLSATQRLEIYANAYFLSTASSTA